MEQNKEENKTQQSTKEEPPKEIKKETYKSYDNSPFDPYERSHLYQQDFINDRVEQRMRMQEKVADQMNFGISNKDKYITKTGKEKFYFHENNVDYHIKKVKDNYDLISKKNEGYKITNEQEDKYYKNYVDNVKPTSLDQIDKELYENEGKRIKEQ